MLDFSLPFLFKILFIFIATVSVYALIGVQLFSKINKGENLNNEYQNFSNFFRAFLVLFKCASGDWRTIMTDCMHYNPYCREDPD